MRQFAHPKITTRTPPTPFFLNVEAISQCETLKAEVDNLKQSIVGLQRELGTWKAKAEGKEVELRGVREDNVQKAARTKELTQENEKMRQEFHKDSLGFMAEVGRIGALLKGPSSAMALEE